jgi:TonB family protein
MQVSVWFKWRVVVALLTSIVPAAFASDLENQVQHALQGKVFTLRNFYRGSKVSFKANGDAVDAKRGLWTIEGTVRVRSVQVKGNTVVIEAERLGVAYNRNTNAIELLDYKEKVELRIAILPASSADQIVTLMSKKVFIPTDELERHIPEIWQAILRKQVGTSQTQPPPPPAREGSRNGDVTAPVVTITPSPSYTQQARKAGLQGTVVISVVVGPDGQVRDERVVRPLGMGLDEEAIKAVKGWRFKPATHNGEAVAVLINIEVGFDLGETVHCC